MKKFFKEFKEFVTRGNILDLAIGVIMGASFKAIITSLTNDILMPLIGSVVGLDVSDWKWVFTPAEFDAAGNVVVAEGALHYGLFIQTIIDFLIIALVLFLIVKVATSASKRREAAKAKLLAKQQSGEELTTEEIEKVAEVLPAPSTESVLLTEIRDLLKKEAPITAVEPDQTE